MARSHILARADRALGEALEKAVVDHHRRRLHKLGWQRVLQTTSSSCWAAGDPPPRPGNDVKILIDGAAAFPEMEREMREARSHIHIADWAISPEFRLSRTHPQGAGGPEGHAMGVPLRDLLAELAERVPVRVLLWAGPPVPWAPLGRREVRAIRDELTRGTKVKCLLDDHERPLHTHHEKMIVVDDQVAFVGGLDPTLFKADRYDSQEHPVREGPGWHDVAAQLRGPAVGDVAAHFNLRWSAVSGLRLPRPAAPSAMGSAEVQVVSTIPEHAYASVPRGGFRILDAYRRALISAQELIYIENQFLWSPEIVSVLRQKLLDPPSPSFRMIIVLPAKATVGTDDTRGQLGSLMQADRHGRLLACAIYARNSDGPSPIYVHAKLAVIDDRWLLLGSANLNDHSLFNDTELDVVICDRGLATETRHRLWAEHLEMPLAKVAAPAAEVVDEVWRQVADEQGERLRQGKPPTGRVAHLPGTSRRSGRLLGPMENLLLDG